MDRERWTRVEALFARVLEATPGERTDLVGRAALTDPELAAEVGSLLAALDSGQDRIDRALEAAIAAQAPAPELSVGQRLGPYRIVRPIGSGGMGVVYLAERADELYRQTVAIKVVRREGVRDDLLARFRTEREILARLIHPGIARLLDGGITEQGLPYLVMEYVEGEPVTDYCDRARLSISGRLRVFLAICDAVQFAHQNLVVHRDIKPSNILAGGNGEVKLLDFGIAKLLELDGSATPAATRTLARLMTPAFASPEQVRGEPVTTATDVYALGLLLYEILTGQRAQPVEDLSAADLERRVCETEPPRAGAAALSGDDAPERAGLRDGASPQGLSRALEGDLETILSKSLRKEPARRYPSVAELADDVRRHLAGLPVLARPDTLAYRVSKFVRRHRLAVGASALALAALLAGLAFALIGFDRARRAEEVARSEAETARQVSEFLIEMFRISDPGEARGNSVTARELLDRGAARIDEKLGDQPAVRARLLRTMGRTYRELGLFGPYRTMLEQELAVQTALHGPEGEEVAATLAALSGAHLGLGSYAEARDVAQRAVGIMEQPAGPERNELANALSQLGVSLWFLGDLAEARRNLERSLAMKERLLGPDHRELGGPLNNLASVLWQQGDLEGARPLYERALDLFVRLDGEDHPNVARTLNNLALVHLGLGDGPGARGLHERALAIRRRILAPDHPEIAESLNNLGEAFRLTRQLPEARDAFVSALEIRERALGAVHPLTASTSANLAQVYADLGDSATARSLLERSVAALEKALGPDHFNLVPPLRSLGDLDRKAGNAAGAERHYRRSLELGERRLGREHPQVLAVRRVLASLLRDQGREADAAALEAR